MLELLLELWYLKERMDSHNSDFRRGNSNSIKIPLSLGNATRLERLI